MALCDPVKGLCDPQRGLNPQAENGCLNGSASCPINPVHIYLHRSASMLSVHSPNHGSALSMFLMSIFPDTLLSFNVF